MTRKFRRHGVGVVQEPTTVTIDGKLIVHQLGPLIRGEFYVRAEISLDERFRDVVTWTLFVKLYLKQRDHSERTLQFVGKKTARATKSETELSYLQWLSAILQQELSESTANRAKTEDLPSTPNFWLGATMRAIRAFQEEYYDQLFRDLREKEVLLSTA